MKREFAVVYEWAGTNYSAYVPDLPGCVSTGKSLDEARTNLREAIVGHLETLREYGDPVPEALTRVESIEVAA
ncbi:MAG: type II toxin-antitoxin system HicB family antitoxin [Fimbriimonadaceae bacterium]|nr:type II toxin-antitoxin system HicB family antitoxin [Fimbriimonadaceae bacterium]